MILLVLPLIILALALLLAITDWLERYIGRQK